jgi:hypothetical protein
MPNCNRVKVISRKDGHHIATIGITEAARRLHKWHSTPGVAKLSDAKLSEWERCLRDGLEQATVGHIFQPVEVLHD